MTLAGLPPTLFGDLATRDLYTLAPVVPAAALDGRRALRLLPQANAPTAELLGRITLQGARALGYLQAHLLATESVPRPAFAQEALARIKVALTDVAYLARAWAAQQPPGGVATVRLTDGARDALDRLEQLDPMIPAQQNPLTGAPLVSPVDRVAEYARLHSGIRWPLEAL